MLGQIAMRQQHGGALLVNGTRTRRGCLVQLQHASRPSAGTFEPQITPSEKLEPNDDYPLPCIIDDPNDAAITAPEKQCRQIR